MKQKFLEVICLLLIFFSFFIFACELLGGFHKDEKTDQAESPANERFDPSFSRLTSVARFRAYCDSAYGYHSIRSSDTERYAAIISETLRARFYHGYSYYRLGQNSLAYFLAPLIKKDLRAIVIPDDILKHPTAACSQQSIVGMEVFKKKGFKVRKVGFFAKGYGGHFCFEVFFGGRWHFFDPDMEPKLSLMIANHFASISELARNDSLLHILYLKHRKDFVDRLFITYSYGPVNKFPAPRARIYHCITKYLSYTSWLFFILLYLLVRKKPGQSI